MATLRPPVWQELEQDEEFKGLSSTEKLKVFDTWTSDMRSYAQDSGFGDDEEIKGQFDSFINQKRPLFAGPPPTATPAEPSLGKVLSDQFASGNRAWGQGVEFISAATGLSGDIDASAQKIAELERANQNVAQTEDMKKFQEAEGFLDSAAQIVSNPIDVALPLFAQSIGSQLAPMAAGAAIGAGAGALTGPGAAVTGLVGAGVGAGVGDAVVSFPDFIRAKGYDLTDPEQVKTALNDPEVIAEAGKKSAARGLVVGATSALGGAVAGKATSAAVAATAGKTLGARVAGIGGAAVADAALQTGIEGLGEAGAQLASTGKLDPKEIAAEMFVQTPTQVAEIAIGTAARIKDTAPQTAAALEQKGIQKAQEAVGNAEVLSSVDVVPDDASIEQQAEELDDTEPATRIEGDAFAAVKPATTEAPAAPEQPPVTQPVTTLRDAVVSSGIADEAADSYISNLRAEGLSDDQIREMADNNRAMRAEDERRNAESAAAQADLARRAREGDAEARAQLEAERGMLREPVAEAPQPPVTVIEPRPIAEEPQPTTTAIAPAQPPVAELTAGAPLAATDAAPPLQDATAPQLTDSAVSETTNAPALETAGTQQPQAPIAQQPTAPAPAQPLAPELAAPTPDAQAYEDSLVAEAKNAGTRVAGTTNKGIKDAIQGKGWYPKTNINKAIRDIKDRVQRRLEAEAPQPAQDTAPAPAPTLPEGADELIVESRKDNAVPSSATINQRFADAPVEQRQAVRREAAKQVANDLGIEYSEELDFAKDFDGNDNLPIRVTQTGTEPVFVNNAEVTARQIDAGFTPVVPEAMRGRVAQGITFDADTGLVTSAIGRGVTTTQPGDLARGVRAQRPGTESQATLATDKVRENARPFFNKLNEQDLRDLEGIRVALQNRTPSSREIAAAFAPDDLIEAGLIKWARERVKDRTLAKDKRKNYSASQIWNFVMKDAAEKLKTMPRSVSLDAPLTETGTMTRGDTVAAQDRLQDTEEAQVQGAREAAIEEDAAIDEGVAADEPTNVSGPIGSASTGMNYDQAFNIINSPVTRGLPKKAVAKLRAEAQELLDMAPQSLIDELENNDIDYWTWTAEDFRNVDTGNTNQIVSSSKRDRNPYIAEQRSWMQQVARSLGMRNVSDFTPPQFTQLARFFADRFRGSFDQGITALPENALAETLPEIRAMFEAPQGAAATYRDAVEQLRSEFPGATIRYSTNHNAAAWYDPRFRNTLFLNPLLLEQELGGLTAAEAQPFLKAVLFEEYIHSVERQNIPRELVIAIAQRLPENVRQRVIDSYVGGADRFASPEARQEVIDSLTEESIGSEYIRMMVQRMRNGLTTEDLDPLSLPQNLFERVMQVVKALIARLQARLQVARDPVLAHTIRALESGMRLLELDQKFQQNPASITREELVFARRRANPVSVDIDDIDNALPPGNGWLRPDGSWVAAETISAGDQVQGWEAEMGQFGGHEAAALEFLSMNDPNAYALLQNALNSPDAFERGYEVVTDYMKRMGWLRVVQQDGDRIVFNGVANKAQERALFTSAILDEKMLVSDNGRRTQTIYEPPTGGIQAARPRGPVDSSVITAINDVYATDQKLSDVSRLAKRSGSPINPPEEGKFVSLQEGTQRYRHNLQVRRDQASALTEWARDNGLLLENQAFETRWQEHRQEALRQDPTLDPDEVANGVEHDVYFDEPSQRWFKRGKGMTVTAPTMFVSYDQYFDRLAAHRALFPDTAMRLEGFVEYEFEEGGQLQRELAPVVSQPHIKAERGATREETIRFMQERGFRMVRPQDKRNGHKNWVNNEGVVVEDLHDENIVVTPEGEIKVIDPVIYLPESYQIQAARPGIRIRGKRVGGAVPRKPGGFFSSGAFTPTERSIILKASQKIAKAAANAEFLVGQFRKAVKKAYGKNPVPADLINQALGSTDNRLTDQQVTDLKKIRDKDARELQRLQFMRDNRDAARIARRDALSQLPAPVAKAVEEMGAKIDELSVTMMNEGYIADDLIPVFEENLELYLHRSYAIFESPEWKDNMIRAGEIAETIRGIADPVERQKAIAELPKTTREHVRVRVAFERFATERAIAEYATEIRRQQKQNGVNITRQDAIKLAKADTATIERKASDLVLRYLTVADQDAYRFFVQGRRIPGRRDMDIIKVRGQVPKELREFWGEIKNAETNFTQTVSKLAAFMAHHDVASELLNNGVTEGYIWKAGVSKDPNPNPEFVPLIPKGTASPDSVSPLYGTYGPVELRDALVQMTQPQNTAGWARAFSFMTAMAMAMKTIGYMPRSFIRNFFGNPLIVLGRGLFNLSDPLSMARALGDGFRVARLNSGLGGNASYQALRERLLELGVIGDNVRGTLLKKLYEESTEGEKIAELLKRTEYDTALEKMGVKTAQGVYKGASKLADIYQGVDDIWKVYAWEMEKVRQKKAHPTWDVRQIEEAAAENVRNLVPTYSLSPDVTQRIRRIPLFAPFITWTSEILRTTGNNIALAKQEIEEGYRTGNTAMRANGAARLSGFLLATAALPAFAMAMKGVMGYDDEDEEAIRTSLRDWQKNAQLIFISTKDQGKVRFLDLSYLDPNQVFVEPLIAASRAFKKGDNPFSSWATELLRPLFSEQLFVGAMADVMRNRTADGRPIVNDQDTPVNKTIGYMTHVTQAIGPGTLVTSVPNIIRGTKGEVSPSGKVFSLSDEVYSQIFGSRISDIDAQTTLGQAAGRYMGSNAEATQLLNDTLLSRGTINNKDIGSAYENANRAKRQIFETLRDNYNAALKLGVPKAAAISILRERKISNELIGQIVNDRYVDYTPTKQTFNEVLRRPDGRARLNALRDYLLQKREQDRNQDEGQDE